MNKVRLVVYPLLGAAVLTTAAFTVPLPDPGTDTALPIPATHLRDGHAARWATCQLNVRINPQLAPPGALEDLNDAFDILTDATGVTFDRSPSNHPTPTSSTTPDDNTIVISWGTAPGEPPDGHATDLLSQSTVLPGHTAGAASLQSAYRGRRGATATVHKIVSAAVVFNVSAARFGGRSGQLGYHVHELIHALGVGHSDHPASVMRPVVGNEPFTGLSDLDHDALQAMTPACR